MESHDDRNGWRVRRGALRWAGLVLASMLIALTPTAARAQSAPKADSEALADLRAEIDQMRQAYEARIADLEARLAALEAGQGSSTGAEASPPPSADDELAALRAAALGAAGGDVTAGTPTTGG
ncbi:MAG: hypothetical protein KDD11_18205, partial [Acidobacteria bacterium]|nr:hypothetical protein [Acidobacteriota bacterium]